MTNLLKKILGNDDENSSEPSTRRGGGTPPPPPIMRKDERTKFQEWMTSKHLLRLIVGVFASIFGIYCFINVWVAVLTLIILLGYLGLDPKIIFLAALLLVANIGIGWLCLLTLVAIGMAVRTRNSESCLIALLLVALVFVNLSDGIFG